MEVFKYMNTEKKLLILKIIGISLAGINMLVSILTLIYKYQLKHSKIKRKYRKAKNIYER